MSSALYIPKKIKVGFQARSGTYTSKLAYIIYFDEKGKLRKQTSWEGWRDKKIAPVEFDNVPTPGFILNKDIQRGGYDWFSDSVVKVRIYDSRDFEFEISTQNLISVLMHTDCLKRGLDGEFVYAWDGKDLVLLPTNSKEYQEAQVFTNLLHQKVSSKSLKPGYAYLNNKQEEVVYLGHFPWYSTGAKCEKKHIFAVSEGWYYKHPEITIDKKKWYIAPLPLNTIKQEVSSVEVTEYPKLLDCFDRSSNNLSIEKYTLKLCPIVKTYGRDTRFFTGKTFIWKIEFSGHYSYYNSGNDFTTYLEKYSKTPLDLDKCPVFVKSDLKEFSEDIGLDLNHGDSKKRRYSDDEETFSINSLKLNKFNPQRLAGISKNKEYEVKQ